MPVETIEAKELWTPAGDYSRRFIVKATDPHEAIVAAKAKTKRGWTFVSANATQAGVAMWEVEVQYDKDNKSSPDAEG